MNNISYSAFQDQEGALGVGANQYLGGEEEKQIFQHLQNALSYQFEHVFPNNLADKTVVIIPSLTLDQEILQKIPGIVHYEERLLCLLLLLRMPHTHVIYITSVAIDPVVVDYYLNLLPGITGYHARQRLTLLSCYDSSPVSLTQKILVRPRLIQRIRQHIRFAQAAHMACFTVTGLERSLAVQLKIPIYGCDPELYSLGNKSNGRQLFRKCNMPVADGFEDINSEMEIAEALAALKLRHPALRKAVVKMNEGFSGEGNAIFTYDPALQHNDISPQQMLHAMPRCLAIVASDLPYSIFMEKFASMGGVVELFLEGNLVASPSVQCRIDPMGKCDIISTHDQVMGGEDSQVFLGAHFPASSKYAAKLAELVMPLCEALRDRGVIGRFGVDFLSIQDKDGKWIHYPIEINLRKGGTTHPYLMMNFLTDGKYNAQEGKYTIKTGQERCYFSTDNLVHECYRGLTPHDLIEIAMDNDLMFNGAAQAGVMFHMIGALSQYGKLGVVCIGKTKEAAMAYYNRTKEVLSHNCR